jgi:uncharacterized protein
VTVSNAAPTEVGSVVSLWRYPVKSMLGEELNASAVSDRGLLGDRAYALVDRSDGKVASAKNPRKWPQLFDCRAAFVERPRPGMALPPVRMTLPDGAAITSEHDSRDDVLSRVLQRDVTLQATNGCALSGTSPSASPSRRRVEGYWPDIEGMDYRDTVTEFALPAGSFFDSAVVHLLTTATLDHLRGAYPPGRFDVRRFRPNLVVTPADGASGFVEDGWIGHTLAIGDAVRIRVTGSCARCVMTTLAQSDLPKDHGILRTAAQQNRANVGVYAAVVRGGEVRRGDPVRLE